LDLTSSSIPLLAADEPAPVIVRNTDGAAPFFLTCDHYGRAIPRALGDLGIDENERQRHIAWDIGIAGVAEAVSDALGAHLIAQRYSRLVIDCNRPLEAASSIPPISEATTIPGNQGLTQQAAFERQQSIFAPYHHAITARWTGARRRSDPLFLCRCTASRRSMPAWRDRGTSARSTIAIIACRTCCCANCAPSRR
jgi:Predicted N-formylglutamate amidohydrolase